jgi:hypothetical protein
MSTLSGGPNIVVDGLVLALDAANTKSYVSGSTVWFDLSRSGVNGTLVNGPTFNSGNGGNINLDGTNDYIEIQSFMNTDAETVIVWVSSNTTNWNAYGWISSSRNQNGHIIHPNPAIKRVDFYINNAQNSTSLLIGSVTPSDITIPHMYCFTTNGINLHRIYLDGMLISQNTNSITRSNNLTGVSYYIGNDIGRVGNGKIYNVQRYNRALSATEILQNFNAIRTRFEL